MCPLMPLKAHDGVLFRQLPFRVAKASPMRNFCICWKAASKLTSQVAFFIAGSKVLEAKVLLKMVFITLRCAG